MSLVVIIHQCTRRQQLVRKNGSCHSCLRFWWWWWWYPNQGGQNIDKNKQDVGFSLSCCLSMLCLLLLDAWSGNENINVDVCALQKSTRLTASAVRVQSPVSKPCH